MWAHKSPHVWAIRESPLHIYLKADSQIAHLYTK